MRFGARRVVAPRARYQDTSAVKRKKRDNGVDPVMVRPFAMQTDKKSGIDGMGKKHLSAERESGDGTVPLSVYR